MESKSPNIRFSLRILLATVTLAAVLLAGWSTLIEPYRRQAAAFDRVNDLQLSSGVFPVTPPNGSGPVFTSNFETMEDSWHRTLVELAVGPDTARKIRSVKIPSGTGEEDLRFILARMRFLTDIDVSGTTVSDEIASALARLPELEQLSAVRSNIGDSTIAELSQSESMKTMKLTANPFGDEAVASLAGMQQLDELFLRWSKITPRGLEVLRDELPNCSIWFQARATNAEATSTR